MFGWGGHDGARQNIIGLARIGLSDNEALQLKH